MVTKKLPLLYRPDFCFGAVFSPEAVFFQPMIAKPFETSTYDLRTLARNAASSESVSVCWQHYREVEEVADVLEWPDSKVGPGG
jgi:hypothetical protein